MFDLRFYFCGGRHRRDTRVRVRWRKLVRSHTFVLVRHFCFRAFTRELCRVPDSFTRFGSDHQVQFVCACLESRSFLVHVFRVFGVLQRFPCVFRIHGTAHCEYERECERGSREYNTELSVAYPAEDVDEVEDEGCDRVPGCVPVDGDVHGEPDTKERSECDGDVVTFVCVAFGGEFSECRVLDGLSHGLYSTDYTREAQVANADEAVKARDVANRLFDQKARELVDSGSYQVVMTNNEDPKYMVVIVPFDIWRNMKSRDDG